MPVLRKTLQNLIICNPTPRDHRVAKFKSAQHLYVQLLTHHHGDTNILKTDFHAEDIFNWQCFYSHVSNPQSGLNNNDTAVGVRFFLLPQFPQFEAAIFCANNFNCCFTKSPD